MLHILEAKLGPVNQDVATTLNNLVSLYESRGEYENARSLCQRLEKSYVTEIRKRNYASLALGFYE